MSSESVQRTFELNNRAVDAKLQTQNLKLITHNSQLKTHDYLPMRFLAIIILAIAVIAAAFRRVFLAES